MTAFVAALAFFAGAVGYHVGVHIAKAAFGAPASKPPPPPARADVVLEPGMRVRFSLNHERAGEPRVWGTGVFAKFVCCRMGRVNRMWSAQHKPEDIDRDAGTRNMAEIVCDDVAGDEDTPGRGWICPLDCVEPLPPSKPREIDEKAGFRDHAFKHKTETT